ncbi:MAG: hypothetical protein AAB706_02295 [Patescibacteria group bacterium]
MKKNVKLKIAKYCRFCRSVLGEYPNGKFNEYTGEDEYVLGCTNPNCFKHCGVVIRHIFETFWKDEATVKCKKCKRCGKIKGYFGD